MIHLPNRSWTWWTLPRARYCGDLAYIAAAADNTFYGFDVIAADHTARRIWLNADAMTVGDDHCNPAILAVEGKPLLLFFAQHNGNQNSYVYKAGWNGDVQPATLASPTTYSWGTGRTINFAIPLADPDNDTVHLFVTDTNYRQMYARSETWCTDFAAQPTTDATEWVDFGQTYQGSTKSFGFCFYRQLDDDPTKCRVLMAAGYEDGRPIRYCEIDLDTGDITASDGTVYGNLRDGTNLPISAMETDSTIEVVYATPSGSASNYAYDMLGGDKPEGLFANQDLTNPDTNSFYYWCQRQDDNSWLVEEICNAGPRFTNSASIGYLAGAQFLESGSVILGRALDGAFVGTMWEGNWQLERWDRTAPGVWEPTVLQTDPQFPLVRAYPVEGDGDLSYVYNRMRKWVQYNNFSGDLIVV